MRQAIVRTVCSSNNNSSKTSDPNYHQKMISLSNSKSKMQTKLDKQLVNVFNNCKNDNTSIMCKIMWKGVYDTLNDINEVNKQTHLHQLYEDDLLNDDELLKDDML